MKHHSKKLIILAICLVSLLLFILLTTLVSGVNLLTIIDFVINAKITLIQNPILSIIMIGITTIGSELSITILTVALFVFMLYRKKIRNSMIVAASMITGLLLQVFIKAFIQRPRPDNTIIQASGFSYPSGHALMSTIFFLILIYSIKDEVKNKFTRISLITISIILIPLIAFSRIYLNVHWMTDVVGGFILGLFVVTLFIFLIEKKK